MYSFCRHPLLYYPPFIHSLLVSALCLLIFLVPSLNLMQFHYLCCFFVVCLCLFFPPTAPNKYKHISVSPAINWDVSWQWYRKMKEEQIKSRKFREDNFCIRALPISLMAVSQNHSDCLFGELFQSLSRMSASYRGYVNLLKTPLVHWFDPIWQCNAHQSWN